MQKQKIINNEIRKQKNQILFENNPAKQKKLSLLTVYTQTIAYYDSLFTPILLSIQLLIFIYKYNILVYEDNVVIGQLILLVLAFFINNWRLNLGKAGNKGKKYGSIIGYIIFTIIIIIGCIYIVAIQQNILWLQFISFIIALIFLGLQLLFMIIVAITYKLAE